MKKYKYWFARRKIKLSDKEGQPKTKNSIQIQTEPHIRVRIQKCWRHNYFRAGSQSSDIISQPLCISEINKFESILAVSLFLSIILLK